MKFEEQAPKPKACSPAWKIWDIKKQRNSTAQTFERHVRYWGIKSRNGERFNWSTRKNFAGFYLTWRSVNGIMDGNSIMPWRKKRDAIAWAQSSAEDQESK